MIPSRGLRWSGQAIGISRRRLEIFSARQFSSVQNVSIRSNSLLSTSTSSSSASLSRTNARSQFSKSNTLIRTGGGIRFASTSPATTALAAATPNTTDSTASSPAASTPEFTTTSLDNAFDFTSDSLYNIPEHIGYLKSLGLDYGWGPTACMEWLLEHVHIYAGTPWWVSIALTAFIVRAALFKAYIGAADNAAKMQAVKPIIQPLQEKMSAALKAGERAKGMQLRQETQMVYRRAGVKVWKSFVPAVQMFAGYGTFVLVRAMAKLPVPGLEHGGVLWFYNLTVPDPFLILPLATAGVMHWVMRRGGETGSTTLSPGAMKLMMYGLPAMTVAFTWWLPAALQLSFFVSGLLSFGQTSLFKIPAFRRFFNMTPLDHVITGPAPPPSSPYTGRIVRAPPRVPLSQAELNGAFQQGRKPQGILQKAKSSLLDNTMMQGGKERAERQRREEYEKRRQAEVRAEQAERKRGRQRK